MRKFKGSPNEWVAQADSINTIVIVDGKQDDVATIFAGNAIHLLTEVEWDNARLIAAAPTLLEVVMKAQESYEKYGHLLNFNAGSLQVAIDEALGKEDNNG